MYSRIAGTGTYLPEKVLTNADLEKMVDTSDEWIRSRTGIERRHIAADDEATSHLAEKAAYAALESASVVHLDVIAHGEVTADRVGMLCCRDFSAAANTFFKLSSGITSSIFKFSLCTAVHSP